MVLRTAMPMTTISLTKEARAVLDRCERTAAWYGVEISRLDQRNYLDDTPLHTTCSWGEAGPVRVLLDAGAKVNARGDRGCTPLFNAVIGESADVVKLLLERGADVSIRSSDGRAVIDYALNTRAPKAVVEALQRASKSRR